MTEPAPPPVSTPPHMFERTDEDRADGTGLEPYDLDTGAERDAARHTGARVEEDW